MASTSSPSPINIEEKGDVTIVTFVDKDIWTDELALAIYDHLLALVNRGRLKIALDFTGVVNVGSALLGHLLGSRFRKSIANGKLVICATGHVKDVFDVCRLNKVFTIKDDLAAALGEFI